MSGGPPPIGAGLGDYALFRALMRARLPRVAVPPEGGRPALRPLAVLDRAAPADPTLALLDAAAMAADIASFYQDRILNEGYLPHAVESASLALLARGLGEDPAAFVGAGTLLALFAGPGSGVDVPAGAAVRASPPKAGAGAPAAMTLAPVFETAAALTARPLLNRMAPLQTRAPRLDRLSEALVLAGTGLKLAAGDPLLLVREGRGPAAWVRLTVHAAREDAGLGATVVELGGCLDRLWREAGNRGPLPLTEESGLRLYALGLTCRLFGYNAGPWPAQPYAVRRAATPAGHAPGAYDDWPGFAVDWQAMDLQSLDPKLLPGSRFLIELPGMRRLTTVRAVARESVARVGLSGQVSRVALDAPDGRTLTPARFGHTATRLPDGRVLLAGGIHAGGVLADVAVYDPASGLVGAGPPLPAPRALHTATLVGGTLYLIGGVGDGFRLAADVLRLDPASLAFAPVPRVVLPEPRIGHSATALPSGEILVGGGFSGSAGGAPTLAALRAGLAATDSVALFSPGQGAFPWTDHLAAPRAEHTATLCPVLARADGTPFGEAIVVFVGGRDGPAVPPPGTPLAVRSDAEVTRPGTQRPLGRLFPVEALVDGATIRARPRFDHVATDLPPADGFLVTGGRDADGPVDDTWLVGAVAEIAPPSGDGTEPDPATAVPVFAPAPPLRAARFAHAAGLRPDGRIVVAGGLAAGPAALRSVETFALVPGRRVPLAGSGTIAPGAPAPDLPDAQGAAAAAVLESGNLFLSGGLAGPTGPALACVAAYDPDANAVLPVPGPVFASPFTLAPTGSLGLADGTVLLVSLAAVDGPERPGWLAGLAWTFDPQTALSTSTGAPVCPRIGASLTLLTNGTVLVAGGMGLAPGSGAYACLASAEIYDPRARRFTPVGQAMSAARWGHTATGLPDGTVLLAGGLGGDGRGLASAEIFDPARQAFHPVRTPLPEPVGLHAAVALPGGNVLLTGGVSGLDGPLIDPFRRATGLSAAAAVYDAGAAGFAVIAPMDAGRALHTATLRPDGRVLIAGGTVGTELAATASTLLYDPADHAFAPAPPLAVARSRHGAGAVPGGVLLIGGAAEPTYEIQPPEGGGSALPLPFALPAPDWGMAALLARRAVPVAAGGHGVYAFGAAGFGAATAACWRPAPPPLADARREALVYTRSRPLALARPLDARPVRGRSVTVGGLGGGLEAGRC